MFDASPFSEVLRMKRVFFFPVSSLILLLMTHQLDFAVNRRQRSGVFNGQTRGVRIVNEFAEVVRQLPEFELRVEVIKYNKTFQPVVNLEEVVHDEKVLKYMLWVDGYEQYGIERIYRRSAIAMSCLFCNAIGGSFFFTGGIYAFETNFPSKCPLKVGKLYYLRDFYLNEKATPPTFPGSKWRFDIQIGPEGKKDTNGTVLLRYYLRIEWYNLKNTTTLRRPKNPNTRTKSSIQPSIL